MNNPHLEYSGPQPPSDLAGKGFYNVLNTTLIVVRGVALSILVARILGPSKQGMYAFLIYIVQVAVQLVNLGFPNTIIRFVAKKIGEGDTTSAAAVIRYVIRRELVLGFCATIGLVLLANPLSNVVSGGIPLLFFVIAALAILPDSLTIAYESSFEGVLAYRLLLRFNCLLLPISLVSAIGVLLLGGGVQGLLVIKVILAFTRIFLYRRALERILPSGLSLDNNTRQEVSGYARNLAAIFFFDSVVWQRSEMLFLYLFRTRAEMAFYDISYMVVGMAMRIIPEKLTDILFPVFAGLEGRGDRNTTKDYHYRSTRLLFAISLPIATAIFIYAPLLITKVYGAEYVSAAGAIRIFCISAPLITIARATAYLLYAAGWHRFNVRLAGYAAAGNILLDVLLIPSFGIIGAAIANSVTQLTAAGILTTYVMRKTGGNLPWWGMGKTVLAGMCQIAAMWSLSLVFNGWSLLVIGVSVGLVVFISAVLAFGILTTDERYRLSSYIRNRF